MKKKFSKILSVGIAIAFVLSLALVTAPAVVALADVYVDGVSGDDTTGDGTETLPYATIQKGVDEVDPNGTVHVAADTYNENVTVPSGMGHLTISGAGKASTTWEADSGDCLKAQSPVTVEGFTFTTAGGTNGMYITASGTSASPGVVQDCDFQTLTRGVRIKSGNAYWNFLDNGFDGCTTGIYTENTEYLLVEGNTFTDCTAGIGGVEGMGPVDILRNTFDNGGIAPSNEGIGLCATANDVLIYGNTFTGCEVGLNVYACSTEIDPDIHVLCNNIFGNSSFGIETDDALTGRLDARKNWWGHPAGPYHPTLNATGGGDNVDDRIDFAPWSRQETSGLDVVPDVELVPDISMNVKTADETFTVIDADGEPVCPGCVTNWHVTKGEGEGEVTVVAGGQDGNNFITVRMVTTGDCIITCDVTYDDVTVTLHAEKKWGEIEWTELTAWEKDPCVERPVDITDEELSRAKIEPDDVVLVQEKVVASFLPDMVPAPAGGAKITWWLLENDEDDLAQLALEELVMLFDDFDFESGDVGWGNGCGQYSSWATPPDPTFIPEDLIDAIYALYPAQDTDFVQAECSGIGDTTKTLTFTDQALDPLGEGITNVHIEFDEVGDSGEAEPVIVVVLADYPLDKNGENRVCVEYIKFTPKVLVPPVQVKTPQVRWAGEKIVLEKDWGMWPDCWGTEPVYDPIEDETYASMDLRLYLALYSLELGSIGNLEPVEEMEYIEIMAPLYGELSIDLASIGIPLGAQQVLTVLGGGYLELTGEMYPKGVEDEWRYSKSLCILGTEQQGQADVNAALYEIGYHGEAIWEGDATGNGGSPDYWFDDIWFEGPVNNHGFLTYFLAFEDVVLAEDLPMEVEPVDQALPMLDVTTQDSLEMLDPDEDDAEVAVQVRGWFTSDALPGTERPAVDLDGDGVNEMPFGRYVMPDDYSRLAGDNYTYRPNWDVMDQAHLDDIVSEVDLDPIDHVEELGAYDTGVVTTFPTPGEAVRPTIGPFNTQQQWTVEGIWNADAFAHTSHPMYEWRNTVVPDGFLNWLDCDMPPALVIFDIVGYNVIPPEIPSLSGLDKGDLEGYGYTGASRVYNSPFYMTEIPSSPYIPGGYNWQSWTSWAMYGWETVDGPYDFWTDMMIDDIVADTEEDPEDIWDVEVYSDNHGIAAVQIDALEQIGTVTVTATAEFPFAPKKGKYPVCISDEITATWGAIELNPHFLADETVVEVDEVVTFSNETADGTIPYTKAEWDFGDGTDPFVIEGTHAEVMADVTHPYAAPGTYDVILTMTDSTPTTRWEERPNYITVTGEVVDILDYYRSLDGDPTDVSDADLLQAAYDWANHIIPDTFDAWLTDTELLQLASEWAS